jgi:acetyltransferase-like isoleucine patch superfamily enzyme
MCHYYAHPTALVETDRIGDRTRIWAFAHVMAGAQVGSDCNICDHVWIETGVTIGDGVTVKNGAIIGEGATIADYVFIGPNVVFTNDRCPRSPRMPIMRERYSDKNNWLLQTYVEVGASIGANVTIVPGIRLGEYCMIAAGSVVTRDVPPYTLVSGHRARPSARVDRQGRIIGPYRAKAA